MFLRKKGTADTGDLSPEVQRLTQENERLKRDIKRLSNIVNLSQNPIWQHDAELKINFCNLAFSEVAEESADKVVETGDLELYKGHRSLARKAWETGEEQSERKHIVVGGERRFYHIRELPVKAEGVITGYARDITEMDALNEEIERHISAQRDLLESSTSAMAVYGKDTRLKFYNMAFVALWKLDETWLDTQPTYGEVLETLREKRKLPEQANFPAFKQQHLRLFTTLIETSEEFFYLPDGKILRVVAIPHALGGILFSYEDVTDRLALERSYKTLIAVQKETLENLHEAVVVFGENGRMRLCNPAFERIWGLPETIMDEVPHVREIMDRTRHLFGAENWDEFKEAFIGLMQQRSIQADRLERTDGKVLDWSSVPLPDGGTLVTFTDVTDSTLLERSLREKNEALEAADKLKTEFLANVSYELRSPLTSISGFADMLKNNYFGELNDKQREYVESIHQSAQNLAQLISNILDLASVEAGYLQMDISEFSINRMLDEVLALTKERTKVLDLKIEKSCSADIGNIRADETRMKQVMFNLLSNAVKYSQRGGTITVGADPIENDMVHFWVQDRGVGIDKAHQMRVFDSFYRSGATTGQQSGTGLGLSIVRSFIELHDGHVELQSEPNKGTRVSCYVPRS